jgi:Universal stress protein family.
MSPLEETTVLLPVDVSGEYTVPRPVLDLLSSTHVVVLGYYPVPSQAAPAQLKHQHEDDARRQLDAIANQLSGRVDGVTDVLVFTHDRNETVDRIASKHTADAILTPGSVSSVDRLLVPLRGTSNVENILRLVESLLASTDAAVTLFHATDDADPEGHGDQLLDSAVDHLVESGIDADRIDRQLSTDEAVTGILAAGDESDVLVIGETEPSLRDRILGRVPSQILEDADGPVFVVRDTNGTESEKDGEIDAQ